MTNEALIEELKVKYEEAKAKYTISSSFETVDKYFGLTDMVQSDEFISEKFIRSINRRILDAYNGWVQFCHAHIMPQPGNMLQMDEAACLNEKDKENMTQILNRIMELSSRNALNGIQENLEDDAKFIDDSVKLWEEEIKGRLEKVFTKINEHWKGKDSKPEKADEVSSGYNGVV